MARQERRGPPTLRATWAQVAGPVRDAFDSLRTGSSRTTERASHIRDGISVRRIFVVYLVALVPVLLFGLYNAGFQIHQAVAEGAAPLDSWRTALARFVGGGSLDPANPVACFVHGAAYFVPLLLAVYVPARLAELGFSVIRREDLQPGTWVFCLLFTLLIPPTTPAWQASLSMVFGIVIGKEIFGGTGRNVVHPVLLAWAFLFVSYPAALSGEAVWVPVAADRPMLMDIAAERGMAGLAEQDWWEALAGLSPGPFGVPSTAACFIGLAVLILAKVVSWRIAAGFLAGSAAAAWVFAQGDPASNPLFGVPVHWHMVLGGWAFGLAFIVTDPVTAAHTRKGRWIYGFLAGSFVIVVRVLNPVQLDGTAVALLFVSLFAALIDYFVIQANIARRRRSG